MIRQRIASEAWQSFQPKFSESFPKITESVGGSLFKTAMPKLQIG
jgi:hypothetical protein